ncbi:hypothetical protein GCM10008090_08280 [Arenicella chitinivorans]|uniref:Protein BatD n=1 Tax=Arenicella chitinivorans TaxID=1329800 RepID=A0A918RLZ1_9GAMM|nr:BatD family protein [Arenicella chitinivorans]GHA01480.1 hypothetical protein GCM10008090_08280 [Arenicella chitinivorans]
MLCTFASFSAWPLIGAAQSLVSTVDRNELTINQTLRLTVTYDNQANTSALDTAKLRSDFDVLGISPQTSSSTTMVNGVTQSSVTTRWSIVLAPKREGQLTIPSFTIGTAKSQPISINVVSAAASQGSDAVTQPLAVSVSVEPEQVYEEQQVILTVQLVISQRLNDLGGSQLAIEGGEIVPLGQQTFQQLDNGIATQVVELRYAIFPEKAGVITIPELKYTGRMGGRRSLFDAFGMNGEQVIARSKPVSIDVLPRVDRPSAQWLPAKSVVLTEAWSGSLDDWQVGQPLTRTVMVKAEQQRSARVSPLSPMPNDDGFKVYQDQPQLDDETSDEGVTATRTESAALVPSQAGELILPEVRLPWFNTTSGVWEVAVLPAKSVRIKSGTQSDGESANATGAQTADPIEAEHAPSQAGSAGVWPLISGVLALIVAGLMYRLIQLQRKVSALQQHEAGSPLSPPQAVHLSEAQAWSALQQHLRQPITATTREVLQTWLRSALKAPARDSLEMLVQRSGDTNLQSLVEGIDRVLFRDQGEVNAVDFADTVSKVRTALVSKSQCQTQRAGGLPPLYPE